MKCPSTYTEVVENNLLLFKKEKYTMADANKLMVEGYDKAYAIFLVLCSAAYYGAHISEPLREIVLACLKEAGYEDN